MVKDQASIAAARRAYAGQVMRPFDLRDQRLEAAFASVAREDFLAPGPWSILRPESGQEETPDDDPVHLYQDALVAILREKGLNNGQPSFLAFLISLGRLCPGDSVVHIGAGQGYYTAIMAEMVGREGKVTAIEYENELAARAAANLSPWPQVRVLQGDGSAMTLDPADVIFVNAGAARPADNWLDAMKDGGRLVLPLTARYTTEQGHSMTRGAVFLIEREGQDLLARWKSGAAIYPCMGARDDSSDAALAAAFEKGGWEKVTRLYRNGEVR